MFLNLLFSLTQIHSNGEVRSLPRFLQQEYLGQCVAYTVVSFLDVLYTSVREFVSIPAIMDNNEAQIKTFTLVKQEICLLPCPVVIMEVLLVLQIRVYRDVYRLYVSQNIISTFCYPILFYFKLTFVPQFSIYNIYYKR